MSNTSKEETCDRAGERVNLTFFSLAAPVGILFISNDGDKLPVLGGRQLEALLSCEGKQVCTL